MKDNERREFVADLRKMASRLDGLSEELDLLAFEIEAVWMKKTTQRSPEFRGKANNDFQSLTISV